MTHHSWVTPWMQNPNLDDQKRAEYSFHDEDCRLLHWHLQVSRRKISVRKRFLLEINLFFFPKCWKKSREKIIILLRRKDSNLIIKIRKRSNQVHVPLCRRRLQAKKRNAFEKFRVRMGSFAWRFCFFSLNFGTTAVRAGLRLFSRSLAPLFRPCSRLARATSEDFFLDFRAEWRAESFHCF